MWEAFRLGMGPANAHRLRQGKELGRMEALLDIDPFLVQYRTFKVDVEAGTLLVRKACEHPIAKGTQACANLARFVGVLDDARVEKLRAYAPSVIGRRGVRVKLEKPTELHFLRRGGQWLATLLHREGEFFVESQAAQLDSIPRALVMDLRSLKGDRLRWRSDGHISIESVR